MGIFCIRLFLRHFSICPGQVDPLLRLEGSNRLCKGQRTSCRAMVGKGRLSVEGGQGGSSRAHEGEVYVTTLLLTNDLVPKKYKVGGRGASSDRLPRVIVKVSCFRPCDCRADSNRCGNVSIRLTRRTFRELNCRPRFRGII